MSKAKTVQFINCRLVRNNKLVNEHLWQRNGKIINPEPVFFDEKVRADIQIDCNNAIIAPGFIDLQLNGGYGIDFSFDIDTVEQGIETVAKGLVKHGVTSFCPTLVTSPSETYHNIIPRLPQRTSGAGILGWHLEGPFINAEKKGAHPENCIKPIENGLDTLLEMYGSLENVKIITLAPEKDPTGATIKKLSEMGITVSLGHSMGSLRDGEMAVNHGARLITHLFNAMLPFHHRDPGLVGLLTSDATPLGQTVYFGLITDGVHTDPAAVRIAYRSNPKGLIVVTDAIAALGLKPGRYHIGQLEMEIRENKAYIAGTDTLCGSIAFLDECVQEFMKATECSAVEAINAVTLHPAQCLCITERKGTLNFGSDADFVMLDNNLNVLSTWIDGECVYSCDASK